MPLRTVEITGVAPPEQPPGTQQETSLGSQEHSGSTAPGCDSLRLGGGVRLGPLFIAEDLELLESLLAMPEGFGDGLRCGGRGG
jgi:hypothetical protein